MQQAGSGGRAPGHGVPSQGEQASALLHLLALAAQPPRSERTSHVTRCCCNVCRVLMEFTCDLNNFSSSIKVHSLRHALC